MAIPLITVVIPVYNEAENIPVLYRRLTSVFGQHPELDLELLFVDDCSTDTSYQVITDLANRDPRVASLQFSKNFGKEVATTAGLQHARGQAVIMIDADGQHPPEIIPQFIERWRAGAEVVIGVRKNGPNYAWLKKTMTDAYYRFINSMSDTEILRSATDFRLLDRKVVDEFNHLSEHNRMTRGLIDWLGFKRETVEFTAPPRLNGRAQYTGGKRVHLAVSSIVSHSLLPLKFAGYLGGIIMFFSGLLGLFIFFEKYALDDPLSMNFSGPAILAVILLFLTGIQLACLGLIALYIGNIKDDSANRPLYVIRSKHLAGTSNK